MDSTEKIEVKADLERNKNNNSVKAEKRKESCSWRASYQTKNYNDDTCPHFILRNVSVKLNKQKLKNEIRERLKIYGQVKDIRWKSIPEKTIVENIYITMKLTSQAVKAHKDNHLHFKFEDDIDHSQIYYLELSSEFNSILNENYDIKKDRKKKVFSRIESRHERVNKINEG